MTNRFGKPDDPGPMEHSYLANLLSSCSAQCLGGAKPNQFIVWPGVEKRAKSAPARIARPATRCSPSTYFCSGSGRSQQDQGVFECRKRPSVAGGRRRRRHYFDLPVHLLQLGAEMRCVRYSRFDRKIVQYYGAAAYPYKYEYLPASPAARSSDALADRGNAGTARPANRNGELVDGT
jgi:hypothetical protein